MSEKQSRDFHDNKGYIQKEIGKDWEAVAIRIKRRLDDRLGVGAKESDGRTHQKRDRNSRQKKTHCLQRAVRRQPDAAQCLSKTAL